MASPGKSPSKPVRSSRDADILERRSIRQLLRKAWTEKDDEWDKVCPSLKHDTLLADEEAVLR